MSGPKYHGWTHRPASEGGTDPIPVTAAEPIWAMASASTDSLSNTDGIYQFRFDQLYSNDSDAFELADVTSGRGTYVQLNTSGYYIYKASINKESGVFSNTNRTWIEPTMESGGDVLFLRGGMGLPDFLGINERNAASEVLASGEAHQGLYDELTFNWNPDDPVSDIDAENPLKVGLNLAVVSGSAISMAAQVWLMRIAAPGYVDLSPA